jgi:hypothetical protein
VPFPLSAENPVRIFSTARRKVVGDFLVDPVWVPPVQDQLLDDLVLSICKLN